MLRRSATMSWWPCLCGSSTSTCAAWPRRTWCGWSSGGARSRTADTPQAAASSASHRRRSSSAKRQSCNKKWTSWLEKTPACDWSWTRFELNTRPCSASPGLSPVGHTVKWPLPASSRLSSLPITARVPPPFRHNRSAGWQCQPGPIRLWIQTESQTLGVQTDGDGGGLHQHNYNRLHPFSFMFSLFYTHTQNTFILSVHCARKSGTGRARRPLFPELAEKSTCWRRYLIYDVAALVRQFWSLWRNTYASEKNIYYRT